MRIAFLGILTFASVLVSCSSKKQALPSQTNRKPEKTIDNSLVRNTSASSYVEKYKTIAIAEMNMYGIPASITLAQGLLESGNGNSSLAVEANNHFGIKCNADWKGKTILRDDDQKDDCFRVYKSAEDSFRDHSEFLKRKRYAFLFELDKNDYIGWANGLKQAGYATNPKYPQLLISLIDRYDLSKYDRKESKTEKIKREDKVLDQIVANIPDEKKDEAGKPPVVMKIYEVKKSDTLYSISKRFGLTVEELKILNNLQNTDLKLGALLLVSK